MAGPPVEKDCPSPRDGWLGDRASALTPETKGCLCVGPFAVRAIGLPPQWSREHPFSRNVSGRRYDTAMFKPFTMDHCFLWHSVLNSLMKGITASCPFSIFLLICSKHLPRVYSRRGCSNALCPPLRPSETGRVWQRCVVASYQRSDIF